MLVMHGHNLALCISEETSGSRYTILRQIDLQSTAVETRHQIRQALALDADVRGQDVVAHRQSDRLHNCAGRVQDRRQ